jgi:hypothetical protein
MSFVMTLWVHGGIVMASDSRVTWNPTVQGPDQPAVHVAVSQTDTSYKTFLTPGGVGISTFGDAAIDNVPIAGHIESFLNEKLSTGSDNVDSVAEKLLTYFQALPAPPKAGFHVAGYVSENDQRVPHVWSIDIATGTKARRNTPGVHYAMWDGEFDVLNRIVLPIAHLDAQGNIAYKPPDFPVHVSFFTVQDAIDDALDAVRVTIDTLRFQARAKTVGGPVDLLVLRPTEARWVQRKELHA